MYHIGAGLRLKSMCHSLGRDSGWLYRVMLEDSEWAVNGGLGTEELCSVVPSSPPLDQSFCIYILL